MDGLSLVNDDDEWLELLNDIDVDDILEISPQRNHTFAYDRKRTNLGLVDCSKIQRAPLILPSSPDDLFCRKKLYHMGNAVKHDSI